VTTTAVEVTLQDGSAFLVTQRCLRQVSRGPATRSSTRSSSQSAPSNIVSVNIDKTAPDVSVTGVGDGAQYIAGAVPTAGCETTDELSEVQTPATLSTSGGPLGQVTASCGGAFDKAGNPGSASVTYTVVYSFAGFSNLDRQPAGAQRQERRDR
jgi:hypothetical protein